MPKSNPVADPGFKVGGGANLIRGSADPRRGYFKNFLRQNKKSGPLGASGAPTLGSANATIIYVSQTIIISYKFLTEYYLRCFSG